MSCEDFQARWDDGDRSPEVAEHVTGCAKCRGLLAVDQRVKAWEVAPATSEAEFLAKLREKLAPRRAAAGFPWGRLAAAAMFLAAVGASFWLGRQTRPAAVKPKPVVVHEEPKPVPKPLPIPKPVEGEKPPDKPKVRPEEAAREKFRSDLLAAAEGMNRAAFLARIKTGTDRARWVAAIRSGDEEARGAAVTIASVARDAAVVPDLAAAGAKGDSKAIEALGAIGGPEGVAGLASIAGVASKRAEVVTALAQTGRPEAAEMLALLGAWWNESEWRRLGNAASGALASRLKSGGAERAQVIRAAGWAKAKGAVPELEKLLTRRELRAEAAAALAEIGGPMAAEALAAQASETDAVMLAALKKAPEGRKAVEGRMLDTRLATADRERAVRVLAAMGDKLAENALIEALGAQDLRPSVATALGALKSDAAVTALIKLLSERRCRDAVAEALGKIGSRRAVPALGAASADRTFRDAAIRALAAIGSPDAVPYLLPAIYDRELAAVVIPALGKAKDARAVLPLIGVLDGPYGAEAHAALVAITGEKLPARGDEWIKWWKSKQKKAKGSLIY